jgi:hypothetical protein
MSWKLRSRALEFCATPSQTNSYAAELCHRGRASLADSAGQGVLDGSLSDKNAPTGDVSHGNVASPGDCNPESEMVRFSPLGWTGSFSLSQGQRRRSKGQVLPYPIAKNSSAFGGGSRRTSGLIATELRRFCPTQFRSAIPTVLSLSSAWPNTKVRRPPRRKRAQRVCNTWSRPVEILSAWSGSSSTCWGSAYLTMWSMHRGESGHRFSAAATNIIASRSSRRPRIGLIIIVMRPKTGIRFATGVIIWQRRISPFNGVLAATVPATISSCSCTIPTAIGLKSRRNLRSCRTNAR